MNLKILKGLILKLKLTLQCEKGSISFIGILFTLIICSLSITHIYKSTNELKSIKHRSKNYLCLKKSNKLTQKYIKSVIHLNLPIRLAFIGSKSPIPYFQQSMQAIHRILKYTQLLYHFSYLKKIYSLINCNHLAKASYITTLVFKGNGFTFYRHIDGTAQLRKTKWTIRLPAIDKKLSLINQFFLNSTFKLQNNFSKKLKVTTAEKGLTTIKDISNLKQFIGSLF